MINEARTFLDALFARCPASSFITLTVLPSEAALSAPSRHIPLRNEALLSDALERLDASNRRGWSGLVGIATRCADLGRWRRGGKQDLAELPALFVDIDDLKGAKGKIANSPILPSCVVASGRGRHLYFYLREPTQDWRMTTRVLHGLTAYFNGDTSVSVAQSMRLPGTINPKPGRAGRVCHILEHDPERRYTLDELACLMPVQPTREQSLWSSNRAERRWNTINTGDLNPMLVHDVEQCLITDFGGRVQANGWLAAYCPCGHRRDGVGAHFGFNPTWGMGVCFGRHGRLRLIDLCPLLGLNWQHYGWVTRTA